MTGQERVNDGRVKTMRRECAAMSGQQVLDKRTVPKKTALNGRAIGRRLGATKQVPVSDDCVSSCGIPLMPGMYQVVGFGRYTHGR